jgi:hypothetical protein
MKVKFLSNEAVEDHNGEVVEKFSEGRVYDLPDTSAYRWIRRNKAVLNGSNTGNGTNRKANNAKGSKKSSSGDGQ